jgi:hypothetical protein
MSFLRCEREIARVDRSSSESIDTVEPVPGLASHISCDATAVDESLTVRHSEINRKMINSQCCVGNRLQ